MRSGELAAESVTERVKQHEVPLYSIEPVCTILNFLCVDNHWVGGGLENQGRSCVKESGLL